MLILLSKLRQQSGGFMNDSVLLFRQVMRFSKQLEYQEIVEDRSIAEVPLTLIFPRFFYLFV